MFFELLIGIEALHTYGEEKIMIFYFLRIVFLLENLIGLLTRQSLV